MTQAGQRREWTGKGFKGSQPERLAPLLQSLGRPHGRTQRCIQGDRDVPQTPLDEAWREVQVEV